MCVGEKGNGTTVRRRTCIVRRRNVRFFIFTSLATLVLCRVTLDTQNYAILALSCGYRDTILL
jgi:hypothetical protein